MTQLKDQDTRNISDFYKYWEHDAIIADLDSKRNQFVVVVERINYSTFEQ